MLNIFSKVRKGALGLALLLSAVPMFSQEEILPGYVLKLNNDTVHGYIKINPPEINAANCHFKQSLNDDFTVYTPKEINEYRLNGGKYYVSKSVDVNGSFEDYFLEYLVEGIVSLYFLKLDDVYYYIERDNELIQLSNKEILVTDMNGRTYQKSSNQFRGALLFMTQDHPEFSDVVTQTTFDQNTLIKTTVQYHHMVCDDFECMNYSKNTKPKIYLEPLVGVGFSWMGYKDAGEKDLSIAPCLGMELRINPVTVDRLWCFSVGVSYMRYAFDGFYSQSTTSLGHSLFEGYHITTDYSSLNLPILVHYGVEKKNKIISFSAGLNSVFMFDANTEAYKVYNAIYYDKGLETKSKKVRIGIVAGVKYSYLLTNKNEIGLFLKYSMTTPLPKVGYIVDNVNVQTLTFGLKYSFLVN